MDYMANHGTRRARPAELVPGTVRAIVARMPYLPAGTGDGWRRSELARLDDPATAVISLYARGRDYHRLRSRLQALASRIEAAIGPFGYRVFTDSAPVMEVALAGNGGLGWRGKHTLLLDRAAGSMFFLGEILRHRAAGRPAGTRSLRPAPALPGHSPDPGHPGDLPARRAPLHLLPDHRAQGRDLSSCARRWATASTAATTASWLAPEQVCAARHPARLRCAQRLRRSRTWPNCSAGARRNSTSGWRAARSAASATSAGCATWLVGLGNSLMRGERGRRRRCRPRRACAPPWRRAPGQRCRCWCASTSTGPGAGLRSGRRARRQPDQQGHPERHRDDGTDRHRRDGGRHHRAVTAHAHCQDVAARGGRQRGVQHHHLQLQRVSGKWRPTSQANAGMATSFTTVHQLAMAPTERSRRATAGPRRR